jgi:hypothetical protein
MSLPEAQKAVGCKWVFMMKTDANRNVVKYKSRPVAQDFSRVRDVEYAEAFAPVRPNHIASTVPDHSGDWRWAHIRALRLMRRIYH